MKQQRYETVDIGSSVSRASRLSKPLRGIIAALATTGVAAFGVAQIAQAKDSAAKKAPVVNKTEALENLAQKDITALGSRIMTLAQQAQSSGIGTSAKQPLGKGLEEIDLTIDVNVAGQPFPDEYYLSVTGTSQDNKIPGKNIQNIEVNEGVKNGNTYENLEFVKGSNTHADDWSIVAAYLSTTTRSGTATERASVPKNLSGIPQPLMTTTELQDTLNQASQIINSATSESLTSLLSFAFPPPAGENLNNGGVL